MSTTMQEQVRTRYVYDFDKLDRLPDGPSSAIVTPRRLLSGAASLATAKATSTGAVLTGERIHTTLVWKPRGTGSKVHTHANEQFNYVLQGTLIADIDGQTLLVPKGHVIHIPAGIPHSHVSSAEDDVYFFAAKDTRYGITGPAVDGKHDGPRYLPGFFKPDFGQPGKNEWKVGSDGLPEPQTQNSSGKRVRYVFNIHELNENPVEDCSAKVTAAGDASKKWAVDGAALTGVRVRVGLTHLAGGSDSGVQTCPHEQFLWVLEGTLIGEIADQQVRVPKHSILHVPADIPHRISAPANEDLTLYVAGPAKA